MPRLVAIDLAAGTSFVDALQRVWARGEAVLPVDQRLNRAMATSLLDSMGAATVIDDSGEHPREGSIPTEIGDALVIASSGSTGTPKGIVLTHDAIAASARATCARLRATGDDHWLACLPLSHVGGLSVVIRALQTGADLTVLPRFDADAVTAAARAGANLTALVSTTLRRVDASLFRTIVVGGSQPPLDRPANVVTTYGLTETASGVVYDGVPLDDVEIEIAHDGEILIRCPMQLRTYRDGTTPVDADGWLHTDDLGHFDSDGRLVVQGRRGDLIISGGENIWPDVVEGALLTHPLVAEVAVVGVEDTEWGHKVAAFVVPTSTTGVPTLDDLRTWAKDRLPAYMAPHALTIVTELPRTALGKIRRSAL